MERVKNVVSHLEWLQLSKKPALSYVPRKNSKTKVRQLSEYLGGLPWNYFVTGTTHYELTLKSARRLAGRYINNLPDGSLFFWVAEKFECKDGYHIHGLIELPESYLRDHPKPTWIMCQLWQIAVGDKKCIKNTGEEIRWDIWDRIDNSPYIKGLGATGYCAKYINKRQADYDIFVAPERSV